MPRVSPRYLMRPVRRAADAVLAALLAPACAACSRPLDTPTRGPVCRDCWAAVRPLPPPLCRTCGTALPSWRKEATAEGRCAACRRFTTAVDAAASAGGYDGTLRAIIHALKYDGCESLAAPLADAMRRTGRPIIEGTDCVVPVPLHLWRRFRRGFNQAALLARHLGPPMVHALWRVRPTAVQASLGRAARRRNVHGAVIPSPLLTSRARRRFLDNRVVLLVDDVSTTGATLDACARVLKAMGVREVRALTAAKAVDYREASSGATADQIASATMLRS